MACSLTAVGVEAVAVDQSWRRWEPSDVRRLLVRWPSSRELVLLMQSQELTAASPGAARVSPPHLPVTLKDGLLLNQ